MSKSIPCLREGSFLHYSDLVIRQSAVCTGSGTTCFFVGFLSRKALTIIPLHAMQSTVIQFILLLLVIGGVPYALWRNERVHEVSVPPRMPPAPSIADGQEPAPSLPKVESRERCRSSVPFPLSASHGPFQHWTGCAANPLSSVPGSRVAALSVGCPGCRPGD